MILLSFGFQNGNISDNFLIKVTEFARDGRMVCCAESD